MNSFGIFLFEVITNTIPYNNYSKEEFLKAKFPPKLPDNILDIDEDIIDLINQCLNTNPHKRPTLYEIATTLNNKLRSRKRGKFYYYRLFILLRLPWTSYRIK